MTNTYIYHNQLRLWIELFEEKILYQSKFQVVALPLIMLRRNLNDYMV